MPSDTRALFVRVFVATYIAVQIAVPVWGLFHREQVDDAARFSWHMFSVVPRDQAP